MPYVPANLKIYHPTKKVSFTVEDDSEKPHTLECFPGFATDAANGASHSTALRWAGGYNWSQANPFGSTVIPNTPTKSIQVVGLDHRGRGGRAWQVVDRGFLFDLREQALLELLLKGEGVYGKGELAGPFIWINDNGMRLVRAGSSQHQQAMLGKAPAATVSEPEQGQVFQVKDDKFLTLLTPKGKKEELWLYTKTAPTQLDPADMVSALLAETLKSPTKRPAIPSGLPVATLQVDLEETYVLLARKILNEPVRWTKGSHKAFQVLQQCCAKNIPYTLTEFISNFAYLQFWLVNEGFEREYYSNIQSSSYEFRNVGKARVATVKSLRTRVGWDSEEEIRNLGLTLPLTLASTTCWDCNQAWDHAQRMKGGSDHHKYKFAVWDRFPQHGADCSEQPVECKMGMFEKHYPGAVVKFGLQLCHFGTIYAPYKKLGSGARVDSYVSEIVKLCETQNKPLIPALDGLA
jgi:hypothetical protein